MVKEIIAENLKTLEIKQIALNKDKFGALTFNKAYPLLHKLRKMFVEFEELGYKDFLTQSEIENIDNHREQLLNYIKRIHDIHPETDASFNKDVRDQIENEIENFYNSTVEHLRNSLIYLRQEVAFKSKDQESLQEERKAVLRVRKQSEEILKQLKKELKAVRKETKEVEEARGERAAVVFGKHFENQAEEYLKQADQWKATRSKFFRWLLGIIIANFVIYFYLFISNKLGWWPSFSPEEFFTLQYGIAKLVLLATLSYAIGFASRNYSINSNLEAINKHRKNVAETLKDFLASEPKSEDRSQLVKSGAEAMFKHSVTGYVSKRGYKDDGPVREIIHSVLRGKGE